MTNADDVETNPQDRRRKPTTNQQDLARARRIVDGRHVRQVDAEPGKDGSARAVLEDDKGHVTTVPWTHPLAQAAREAGSHAGRCFELAGGTPGFNANARTRRKAFEVGARLGGNWSNASEAARGTISFPDDSTLTFGPGGTVEIAVAQAAGPAR